MRQRKASTKASVSLLRSFQNKWMIINKLCFFRKRDVIIDEVSLVMILVYKLLNRKVLAEDPISVIFIFTIVGIFV